MSAVIRMKVKCTSREESIGSHWNPETKAHEQVNVFTYRFAFATGAESPENEKFWSATPNGTLQLQAVKHDLFDLGQHYYLDAIPAP